MFRIAILAILIYLAYSFFKGLKSQPANKGIAKEELIKCDRCGTYLSDRDALKSFGKRYCSKECKNQ